MNTTEVEIAWAAGLWEGEGTACVVKRNGNKNRLTDGPHVALAMTDEEPVRKFYEIMGFGHFHAAKKRREEWKALYWWKANKKSDVPKMAVLLSWLSPRRAEQLSRVIAVCVYVDQSAIVRERWINGVYDVRPLTPRRLKTHCKRGHELTERPCRECGRMRARDYQRRKAAARRAA